MIATTLARTRSRFTPRKLPTGGNQAALYLLNSGVGGSALVPNSLAANQTDQNINYCLEQNLADSQWYQSVAGGTITDNFAANPTNGATTATRVQFAAGASSIRMNNQIFNKNTTYTMRVWAKANSGGPYTFRAGHGASFATFVQVADGVTTTVDGTWREYSATFTTGGSLELISICNDGATASDLLIYRDRIYQAASGQADVPSVMHGVIPSRILPSLTPDPTWSAAGLVTSTHTAGVPAILSAPITNCNALSLYVVVRQSSAGGTTANNFALTSLDAAGGWNLRLDCNGNHITFSFPGSGSITQTLMPLADDADHIIAVTLGATACCIYLDGYLVNVVAGLGATTFTFRGLDLGGGVGTGNGSFIGNTYLAGCWEAEHSAANVQSMTRWLRGQANARSGVSCVQYSNVAAYEGDSLTGGSQATCWPFDIHPNLPAGTLDVLLAKSGSGINPASSLLGTSLTARGPYADAILLANPALAVLVIWTGANDLGFLDAVTFFGQLQTYVAARRAAGWSGPTRKILVATVLPRTDDGGVTFNGIRNTFNTNIRADFAGPNTLNIDGLIDVAADPIIGPDTAPNNTVYYIDKLHLTNYGETIAAGYFQRALSLVWQQQLTDANAGAVTDAQGQPVYVP